MSNEDFSKIKPDKEYHFFVIQKVSYKKGEPDKWFCQTTPDNGLFGYPNYKGGEKRFGKISFEGSYEEMVDFINNAVPLK